VKNRKARAQVEAILESGGFPYELLENRIPIRSAAEGAAYWGIELGRTAPALVLETESDFLLLIVSGVVKRVDFGSLDLESREKGLRMATAGELLGRFGIRPGEVPLFGLGIPAFIDRRLMAYDFVYGGSGIPGVTLKIAPASLLVLNRKAGLVDVPSVLE